MGMRNAACQSCLQHCNICHILSQTTCSPSSLPLHQHFMICYIILLDNIDRSGSCRRQSMRPRSSAESTGTCSPYSSAWQC